MPEGAPLELDLRLESVTEGVLVTGTVTAPLTGECGRCLDPVDDDLEVEVCELFAYPNSATDETTEQDEVYRIEGDLLDVEPVVRDAVVLALPWTPLCRPDCAGLCPDCGQRLDDLPAGHTHDDDRPALGRSAPRFATDVPTARPHGVDRSTTSRRTTRSGVTAVAVPKRKMSRSNTRARRSQWKTTTPTLVTCPNRACGEPKLPHTACNNCGQYDGKQVLAV